MATIVGPDQTCGVRGQTISENLAGVRDLLEYVEREDIPLALLSLDQEKAFDRVDLGFLLRILETFNVGPQFRNWVRLFYTDIQSAVIINGWMSSFFNPTRGVRAPGVPSISSIVCPLHRSACGVHSCISANSGRDHPPLGGGVQVLRLRRQHHRGRHYGAINRDLLSLFYIREGLWR